MQTLKPTPAAIRQFREQERFALQAIVSGLSELVNLHGRAGVHAPASSAQIESLKRLKAGLQARLAAGAIEIAALASASAAQTDKARDAQEKAKILSVIAAVIMVVVAVVLAVVTFGAGAASISLYNIVSSILTPWNAYLRTAAANGHPLAGELARIFDRLSLELTRNDGSDAARERLLAAVERSLVDVELLTRRIPTLKNFVCVGDRETVLEACRKLPPLVSGVRLRLGD